MPTARTAALLAAPPVNPVVDARLLVITVNGTDPGYSAIVQTLRYLGTPYDVFNASTEPPLTAARLATGNHGRYYGIVLDVGNLSNGTASELADAEWTALTDYEGSFKVRRASVYTFPEAAYGLTTAGNGFDSTTTPLAITCTALGATVFPDVNCASAINVHYAWAYPAAATDAATLPLFTDGAGKVFGAIRQNPDGREALVLTFAQAPSLVHSLALLYDVVGWVTRGVYLGEHHTYSGTQIDDLFLSSDLYNGNPEFRISDGDLQALAAWQAATRAQPVTAAFRMAWAVNGVGSTPTDPLTLRAQAIGTGFEWINHTWDHPYFNPTIPPGVAADEWAGTYALALPEFTKNITLIQSLGLQPFSVADAITPSVSGLDNPEAMRAIHDAGIRYLVTDTSVAGQDNPSPNAGYYNPSQPDILEIPRRPTNLFYNVSTPAEWTAEYNVMYRAYWGHDLTYAEIIDVETDVLLQYLLRGENDLWMFHQANAHAYSGGRSLLADLHDSAFGKYAALSRLPVVNPTMTELGGQVAARMKYDASGASAVIGPGRTITVGVASAATVPVTGLCTPSAETYAGAKIAHVALSAGAPLTFSLDACADGTSGAGGAAGGAGGHGGVAGTGGSAGATGIGGRGGATGAAGRGGIGGSGVAPGVGGTAGTAGAGGTGGVVAIGGAPGVAGAPGAGGVPGTGGAAAAGGAPGKGGGSGSGGLPGAGGSKGTGGASSTGGAPGTGGLAGAGGRGVIAGSGGKPGAGGTTAAAGSGGHSAGGDGHGGSTGVPIGLGGQGGGSKTDGGIASSGGSDGGASNHDAAGADASKATNGGGCAVAGTSPRSGGGWMTIVVAFVAAFIGFRRGRGRLGTASNKRLA